MWNTGYLRPALAFLANHGIRVTDVLQDILEERSEFFDEYDRLAHDELAKSPEDLMKDWDILVAGGSLKINLAFAGRLLLFDNPFDDFFHLCLERHASSLPEREMDIFHEILLHCRASRIDLDNPGPRSQRLMFDVPGWVAATYPKDTAQFEHDVEYQYELDPVCLPALRVRDRHRDSSLNHLSERIIMEVPEVYRRTRMAVGMGSRASEDLQQRMAWAG